MRVLINQCQPQSRSVVV